MTPKIRCIQCKKLRPLYRFQGSDTCLECRVREAREQAKALRDDVNIDDLFEVKR